MNAEQKEALILEYLEGNLTETQAQAFGHLLETGEVRRHDVERVQSLLTTLQALPDPEPAPRLEQKFNRMLAAHIEQAELDKPQLSWAELWARLGQLLNPVSVAYTLMVFALGVFTAWLVLSPKEQPNGNEQLASELSQVKQLLFATLLEQPNATDRLKAVNFSHEIADADGKVIDALFRSLNQDSNVNVRLAALEALMIHTAEPEVRERLIQSINRQESPIVQIALADLMQALQEKNALPQLKRLLENESTNELVKDKIQESINLLI